MPAQTIKISGARQHNLKNLHVEIPREKLVVITGLSGSGAVKVQVTERPVEKAIRDKRRALVAASASAFKVVKCR